jgi:hypothetical protein
VPTAPQDVGKASGVLPFWHFIPTFLGTMVPGANVTVSTPCFDSVALTTDATIGSNGLLRVGVNASGKTGLLCDARFAFFFNGGSTRATIEQAGAADVNINTTGWSDLEMWGLKQNGVRIMLHNTTSMLAQLGSLLDTLTLFEGMGGKIPSNKTVHNNIRLWNAVTQMKPFVPNGHTGAVVVNESDIHDGSVIFQTAMNGVDTENGLAFGTQAGHAAMAIRDDAGKLQVCESPTPVTRCTPYAKWVADAQKLRKMSAVVPLSADIRANFNRTAAWAFLQRHMDQEYGFQNLFFSWVDTVNHNYPCFPPDFKRCLAVEHFEYLALWADRLSPALGNKMFGQAFDNRIGAPVGSTSVLAALRAARARANATFGDLMSAVELDSYRYDTRHDRKPVVGRSMMCSVFVCFALREAGVFGAVGDQIQCQEQTPWNLANMKLFDDALLGDGRPKACRDANPDTPLCQVTGDYTYYVNSPPDFNSRAPFAGIGQSCASRSPGYYFDPKC